MLPCGTDWTAKPSSDNRHVGVKPHERPMRIFIRLPSVRIFSLLELLLAHFVKGASSSRIPTGGAALPTPALHGATLHRTRWNRQARMQLGGQFEIGTNMVSLL